MRIIISVQPVKYPMTGIGRYTLEVANNISVIHNIKDIKYFDGFRIMDNIQKPNYKYNTKYNYVGFLKKFIGKNVYIVYVYKKLLIINEFFRFIKMRQYIYHSTNFYLPNFAGRKIVTIHDLSVISHPEYHPIERVRMLSQEIEKSIYSADYIITDSAYVKEEIVQKYNVTRSKIHVVHLSHSNSFHVRIKRDVDMILKKYEIEWKRYILFVGTIEPRKNIISLIFSFKEIRKYINSEYKLVIVGHSGWNNEEIMEEIERGVMEGWIVYVGFVEEEELPKLYSGANLFVYPSFYEGFGLPILEAMASGVPVVASNSSSIPEVSGNAAALCDPSDRATMSELILRGIIDEEWRANAISRGLERARCFSWEKCARETYRIYEKLSS